MSPALDQGQIGEIAVDLVDQDVLRGDVEASYRPAEGDVHRALAEPGWSFQEDKSVSSVEGFYDFLDFFFLVSAVTREGEVVQNIYNIYV